MSSASLHGPGSPPRGRGKVDGPPAQVGRGRITPAQAGRSPYFLYGKKDYKDHPRIGGEKAELTAAVISAMGSPPRGRGKVSLSDPENAARGITPAWAGKRLSTPGCKGSGRDHPRVGGEKLGATLDHLHTAGSPPRGRGKAVRSDNSGSDGGITPAWAGKSAANRTRDLGLGDHPRVGGEKCHYLTRRTPPGGSPPRGRGKGFPLRVARGRDGITPAWAGKSP